MGTLRWGDWGYTLCGNGLGVDGYFWAMRLTLLVLFACVGASLWAWGSHPQSVWLRWGLIPYRLRHYAEWYRVLTATLFHADFMHLLLNAVVFYSFGSTLERQYGRGLYALLLLAGALGSALADYWRYKDNPQHVSIGLSGVVNAVLFAFILHYPKAQLLVFGLLPLPAWLFALLYLAYSLYAAHQGRDYVNHWAHLGGAAAGIVFAYLLPL